MASLFVLPFGSSPDITIPAGESIAVACQGQAQVWRKTGFPNYPETTTLIGTVVNGQTVFGPYTPAATLIVEASGGVTALYEVGTAPQVQTGRLISGVQAEPLTLNATGTVTPAMILNGILTSTTAAAVTGTLPTGAVMDLSSLFLGNDFIEWTVINTGGTNAFTIQAATGHTIVGSATVALSSSARFRTRKTAADTFVTYRV